MISLLQRSALLARLFRDQLRSGHVVSVSQTLAALGVLLTGRRLGAPLAQLSPARAGEIIGGPEGDAITRLFAALRGDLDLLYTALIRSAAETVDTYELFAARHDRLKSQAAALREETQTLLAQQNAGSQNSFVEHFQDLTHVDPVLSTVEIDLQQGLATLPVSNQASIRYDGSRVQVVQTSVPPGTQLTRFPFGTVFSPYRTDAWVIELPAGASYVAQVNLTGADFEQGDTEEVLLNALGIDPTGPLALVVDWSPDGLNWHDLDPVIKGTIRAATTFHFSPVSVGFLRFQLSPSAEALAGDPGSVHPIGVKTIAFYRRGYSSSASLYSTAFSSPQAIHTAVVQVSAAVPAHTRIDTYLAQNAGGPWRVVGSDPVTFDTVAPHELGLDPQQIAIQEEVPGLPATLWEFPWPAGTQPIPELGELVAGRGQVELAAFPYDWTPLGEPDHVLVAEDWQKGYGVARSGTFDLTSTTLLGTDSTVNALTLALLDGSGNWVLQPGFNYRMRVYLFCPTAITLEDQVVGVVNSGGTAGTVVAPLSLVVNGTKRYQQVGSVSTVPELSGRSQTVSLPLLQGTNVLELYFQIPAGLAPGVGGVATGGIALYFQPNLFAPNLQVDLGIDTVQAYPTHWRQVSEFDLRYNVAPGETAVWAWKYTPDGSQVASILLNFDPSNSRLTASPHASQRTIDGLNLPNTTNLLLRYTVESTAGDLSAGRDLFFRAELVMGPEATAPPTLNGYSILTN